MRRSASYIRSFPHLPSVAAPTRLVAVPPPPEVFPNATSEVELSSSFMGPLELGTCPATQLLPAASADADESSEYARWTFFGGEEISKHTTKVEKSRYVRDFWEPVLSLARA